MNRLARVSQSVLMLAFVAGALGFAGCAEEVGTLDRTRPDRVDKSIFQNDDEWYFRQTIIETDFQGSYGLFEGLETPLKRIQWTITEDTLFAHTTVEPAIGASKDAEARQEKTNKQLRESGGFDKRLGVVAAFPITSHFDVQRGYNPQTGQLSNVLSENTSDKLWFDRKYMRVDWGRMSIDSVGYSSELGSFASVTRTPGEVNPEADPNRTRVTEDVVDTVTEYYFEPDRMSCFSNFGLDSVTSCEAGALKVRSYFMKMPKKQTYQPKQYIDQETFVDEETGNLERMITNEGAECSPKTKAILEASGTNTIDRCRPVTFDLFNRFGYFRTERSVYTKKRANYEDQRLYFAKRRKIWHDSFDKEGNLLPMEQRKPKRIVYHTNVGFPQARWRGVEKVASEWNRVFTDTVRLSHNITECSVEGINSALISYQEGTDEAIRKNLLTDMESEAFRGDSGVINIMNKLAGDRLDEMSREEVINVGRILKAEADGGTPFVELSLTRPDLKTDKVEISSIWGEMASGVSTSLDQALKGTDRQPIVEAIKEYFQDYKDKHDDVLAIIAKRGVLGKLSYNATYLSKDPIMGVLRSLAQEQLRREFIAAKDGKLVCEEIQKNLGEKDPLFVALSEIDEAKSSLKSVTIDVDGTAVKKLIADSNPGECTTLQSERIDDPVKAAGAPAGNLSLRDCSGEMYVILPNSCSPQMLMKWKEDQKDGKDASLPYDVDVLFEGMDEDTLKGMEEKRPKELEKFCAKLEIATENAPNKEDRFTWQRIGDLNHSFINWVFSDVPWLGYGPSAADPETGEIISGNANFAGKVLESYAQGGVDRVRVFGKSSALEDDNFIWGDYFRREVQGMRENAENHLGVNGFKPTESRGGMRSLIGSGSDSQTLSGRDLVSKASAADLFPHYPALNDNISDRIKDKDYLNIDPEVVEKLKNGLFEKSIFAYKQNETTKKLKQEKIGKVLNMPEVRSARLKDPDFFQLVQEVGRERFGKETLSDDELAQAYAEVSDPSLIDAARKQFRRKLAERNIMTLEGLDLAKENTISYIGVTNFFDDGQGDVDSERVRRYFSDGVFYSTQLHEVGHTVGLRHNFQGSTDALNFHPVYWDIRAKLAEHQEAIEKAVKEAKRASTSSGKSADETAKAVEAAKGMEIEKIKRGMESDTDNCSDEGAVKVLTSDKDLLYLTWAQVKCLLGGEEIDRPYFSETEFREASIMDYTPGLTSGFNGLGRYDNAAIQFAYADKVEVFTDEVPLTNWYRFIMERGIVDYRKFPELFAKRPDGSQSAAAREKLGIDRMVRGRTYIDTKDAKARIREQVKFNGELLLSGTKEDDLINVYRSVPYGFCSDEREGGQLGCSVFDYGVTQSEILKFVIDDFQVNKNFRRYRRGRKEEANQFVRTYSGWLFRALASVQQPFYFYNIYKYFNAGDFTKDLESTAAMGLNFIAEVFAQPEPGPFCIAKDPDATFNPLYYSDYSNVYLPLSRVRNGLKGCLSDPVKIDRNKGAFNGFETTDEYHWRVSRVGGFLDKQIAIQMMFNITGSYNREALLDDIRAGNASYWTTFQDQIYNFTSDIVLERMDGIAGVIKDGAYEAPQIVDPSTVGDVFDNLSTIQQALPRVYTRIGFSNQWYTMISAMAANDTFYDTSVDISEYMAVCLTADECNREYPEGTDFEEFSHPVTPQKYIAPIAKNGQSITAEVIKTLNILKAEYLKAKTQAEDTNASQAVRESAVRSQNRYSNMMESQITKLDRIRFIKKALGK